MKKFLVGLMGGTVLLLGIAMVILPGPAILVIPCGLAILATEFVWARRCKEKFEAKCADWRRRKKSC